MKPMRSTLWALALVMSCSAPLSSNSIPVPSVLVWAWERNEDLSFLTHDARFDPTAVGVASLRATLIIHPAGIEVRRRVGTLRVPSEVRELPVVRIEPDLNIQLDSHHRVELVALLLQESERAGLGRLQVDFEALRSQRTFYRDVLQDLRRKLGREYPLSITALSSWCLGDRWMQGLPVDEVVPMFYRLGKSGPALRQNLRSGRDLAAECRRAHGLITDEDIVAPPTPRRLYLFSPQPWTADRLAMATSQIFGQNRASYSNIP